MRHSKALFGVILALALAACSNPQYLLHPTSNPMASEARQKLDSIIDTSTLKPLTWGTFLSPPKGAFFKPMLPTDSRNAMVYVYRLRSDWNDAEVQTPGFFLNGEYLSGLKGGSYFWFEVPASSYDFNAKRPLAILYFSTIFDTDVNFEGGKSYYFRYDEENPGPKKPARGSALLVVGPLHQIPESQALAEITQTRSMGVGRVLYADPQPQWAPFDVYPDAQPVQADSLDSQTGTPTQVRSDEEIQAEQGGDGIIQARPETHWWNPFSW